MGQKDTRVDAYINSSADFAKPILRYIREIVHEGCPEVKETMKWSFPHFEYKGILCSMAAFKSHCAFGFWKGSLILGDAARDSAMGQFGRITTIQDLPPQKKLLSYVKEAVRLNEKGIKVSRAARSRESKQLEVPEYFLKALQKNKKAFAAFEKFPYSHKKEYVEWITEAKTEATRQRRIATAIEWMAEGKGRNWKYERQ